MSLAAAQLNAQAQLHPTSSSKPSTPSPTNQEDTARAERTYAPSDLRAALRSGREQEGDAQGGIRILANYLEFSMLFFRSAWPSTASGDETLDARVPR